MRIYISQIINFRIHMFNEKREVTRINVAILLYKPRFMRQTSLSLFYTKPTSFILCHFWTEIERDKKQYSVLSIGHIHTGKEWGGGGLRVLASRSISVRIDLKSGMKVCEILLQTVYSDAL